MTTLRMYGLAMSKLGSIMAGCLKRMILVRDVADVLKIYTI
jgi:hypothetical protein